MSNQEILEKAIHKAIDGGWKQDLIWIHGNVKNPNEVFMKQLEIDAERIYWSYDEYVSVPELIFSHEFAKALWGEEWKSAEILDKVPDTENTYRIGTIEPCWQWHLQNMVIADDPIKYLGENL